MKNWAGKAQNKITIIYLLAFFEVVEHRDDGSRGQKCPM